MDIYIYMVGTSKLGSWNGRWPYVIFPSMIIKNILYMIWMICHMIINPLYYNPFHNYWKWPHRNSWFTHQNCDDFPYICIFWYCMFARGSSLIIFPHHRQGCSKGSSCSFCHHLVTDEEAQLAAARPRKLRRKRIKANLKARRKKNRGESPWKMDSLW